MRKKNTCQFIIDVRRIHGDKYDYSKVEYINSKIKVKIICPEHGEFEQPPNKHLRGQGCFKCAGKLRNTYQFIEDARKIHGYKYDYSKVEYETARSQLIIICSEHGEFEQIAYRHLQGGGCHKCAGNLKKKDTQFIEDAKRIHGDKYDYSKVKYVNSQTKIIIICPEHGEFEQTPHGHLKGRRCPQCFGTPKKSTEQFIMDSRKIHENKYDYSKVKYSGNKIKVKIICPEHGIFEQTPNSHLKGSGCPQCSKNNYSQVAIDWLEHISKEQGINIRHAQNGGEYRIPKTRMKADGYCAETNTIYEFHGDRWHGNPSKYNPEDYCHPRLKNATAGELYQQTIERENIIKSLGYNLVVIWESDWNKYT